MDKCFWLSGCANSRRCREAGMCIAKWQNQHKDELFKGDEEMNWKEARDKWSKRLMETTSGQEITIEDMTLICNLIQAADAEIDTISNDYENLMHSCAMQQAEDKAEIARLREALEFYANQSNWAMHPEFANACCLDSADYGQKARKALKGESDDV